MFSVVFYKGVHYPQEGVWEFDSPEQSVTQYGNKTASKRNKRLKMMFGTQILIRIRKL